MADVSVNSEAAATGTEWEPRVIAFLCYWCSYTGADNAGIARLKMPANVDIVRVNCSGRVDPSLVTKSFARGADGVMVCGCHPGCCHYISGNFKTMARMPLLRRVLEDLGIEEERFVQEWVSASEAEKFAALVRQTVKNIRPLGPLNWPQRMYDRGVGHGQDRKPWGE
jgi:F420-non-reducing hydrogenase iron-sulfur subunit